MERQFAFFQSGAFLLLVTQARESKAGMVGGVALLVLLPVSAMVGDESAAPDDKPSATNVCISAGVEVAGKLVLVGAPVVRGTRISSPFAMRIDPVDGGYTMHTGADIAAPYGSPVRAPWAGIIEKAGREERGGLVVRIKHNAALATAYAHLSALGPHIAPGGHVARGQLIGFVGNSGRCRGAHLHYSIIVSPGGRRVDPVCRETDSTPGARVEARRGAPEPSTQFLSNFDRKEN